MRFTASDTPEIDIFSAAAISFSFQPRRRSSTIFASRCAAVSPL
jgi:hypothetical protein